MGKPSRRKPSVGTSVLSLLTALSLALAFTGDAVAGDRDARDASIAARKAATAAAVKKPQQGEHRRPLAEPSGSKLAGVGPTGLPGGANRPAVAAPAHHALLSSPAAVHAFERRRVEHRAAILATRSRLPARPLPGERGFTGVPPPGEKRFVSSEMVFHVGPNVSRQAVDDVARKLGLSTLGSHSSALTGGTLYRFRVADGRAVADTVRALEAEKIGVAQPNYVFKLQQDAALAARTKSGASAQYVVNKLRLGEAHRVATGSNVLVAV